jgi:hypothetical protein
LNQELSIYCGRHQGTKAKKRKYANPKRDQYQNPEARSQWSKAPAQIAILPQVMFSEPGHHKLYLNPKICALQTLIAEIKTDVTLVILTVRSTALKYIVGVVQPAFLGDSTSNVAWGRERREWVGGMEMGMNRIGTD